MANLFADTKFESMATKLILIHSFIPLSYCYSDDNGADMLEIILEMLTDLCVHTVYFEPVNYDFLPMLLGFGFEFNHPFYDSMYLDLY